MSKLMQHLFLLVFFPPGILWLALQCMNTRLFTQVILNHKSRQIELNVVLQHEEAL